MRFPFLFCSILPWTCNISIIWELVNHVNSWPPPQTYSRTFTLEILRVRPKLLHFYRSAGGSNTQPRLRITAAEISPESGSITWWLFYLLIPQLVSTTLCHTLYISLRRWIRSSHCPQEKHQNTYFCRAVRAPEGVLGGGMGTISFICSHFHLAEM